MLLRHIRQNRLDILPKSHVQHLIRLVQNDHSDIFCLDRVTAHMIHDAARRSHHNLYALGKRPDLSGYFLSSVYGKNLDSVGIFRQPSDLLRCLNRQLPGWTQHDSLQLFQIRIRILYHGNSKGRRLSRSGLGLTDNIPSLQQHRNRLLLDRRHGFKSHLLNRSQNPTVYIRIFKPHFLLHVVYFLLSCAHFSRFLS